MNANEIPAANANLTPAQLLLVGQVMTEYQVGHVMAVALVTGVLA